VPRTSHSMATRRLSAAEEGVPSAAGAPFTVWSPLSGILSVDSASDVFPPSACCSSARSCRPHTAVINTLGPEPNCPMHHCFSVGAFTQKSADALLPYRVRLLA